MLKALYAYNAPFPGTLKFNENDIFLDICSENENWLVVSGTDGSLGCVPSGFVVSIEAKDQSVIIEYAKKALGFARSAELNLHHKEFVIQRLRELAGDVNENANFSACTNGIAPVDENTTPSNDGINQDNGECDIKLYNSVGTYGTHLSIKIPSEPHFSTGNLASLMVDVIRLGTKCDYFESQETTRALVKILCSNIPQLKTCFKDLDRHLNNKDYKAYTKCPDWYQLLNIFNYLETLCKNDELLDELIIMPHLRGLHRLLQSTDPNLIAILLQARNFRPFSTLVQFLEFNQNPLIWLEILGAIRFCCALNQSTVLHCMNSKLPVILFQKLQDPTLYSNIHLFVLVLHILSTLFIRSSKLPAEVESRLTPDLLTHVMRQCNQSAMNIDLLDLKDSPQDSPSLNLSTVGYTSNRSSSASIINSTEQPVLLYWATIFLLASNWHFCSIGNARRQPTSVGNLIKIPLIEAISSQSTEFWHPFFELVMRAFNLDLDPPFMMELNYRGSCNHHLKRLTEWSNLVCDKADSMDKTSLTALFGLCTDSSSQDEYLNYAKYLWVADNCDSTKNKTSPLLPTNVFSSTPKNTVIKFLCDLFAYPESSIFVGTDHVETMLNKINNHLLNINPESEVLLDKLLLVNLISANTDYFNKHPSVVHTFLRSLQLLMDMFTSPNNLSANLKRGQTLITAAYDHLKSLNNQGI